ncbi:RNA-dependent RNA polymerase [Alxa virus]|uniref:RNA-directed RNA polymerase L n=2 Tax=Arenaviridae TaxID=11617 RepID=A0A2H4RDS4_9VIRU|nr:RNA-dependent RNA polymerase [Alxa virus]ATY47648.1 RNA-dependent RNA polymerase [Alxa virus]
MDELLVEIKDLVLKNFPFTENLSKQKLSLLSQREPKFILMEGLKLLSTLIEVDSCESNNCIHNFENLSVEQIVINSGKPCPSLPFVTPDGYRVIGENIILLECFVRASPASFEQKYKEDSLKLITLKEDLAKIGLNMIPLIDGRSNYNNKLVPDWVVQRLKYLLIKITEYEQENSAIIEQAEYDRLIESLNSRPEDSIGVENLNILKDKRTTYHDDLIKILSENVNNDYTSLEVSVKLSQIYNEFRTKLKEGKLVRHLVPTDKSNLLREFSELYDVELRQKLYYHRTTLSEIINDAFNSNQIVKACIKIKPIKPSDSNKIKLNTSYSSKVLSLLNKVKSMKILNTHRNALLYFDVLLLNSHVFSSISNSNYKCSLEWKSMSYGGSIMSVNDRLISVEATINEYLEKLNRLKIKNENLMSEEQAHQHVMRNFIFKIKKKLQEVNISESVFSLNLDDMRICELNSIKLFHEGMSKALPIMKYERECLNEDELEELQVDEIDFKKLFENVSSVCLSLCNSMKTSSICKLRQNESHQNRFKSVTCKECFTQPLIINNVECFLIYQKTGESSKCYSICNENGDSISFYADPKRFFLPIFSWDVLIDMVDVMITWISKVPGWESKLKEIRLALLSLTLLIISNPSKRVQKMMQNYRYYLMAYVNSFHLISLMDKLKEELITDTEYHIYRLLNWLNKVILAVDVEPLLTNRFKLLLNVSYLCHLITKETPDRNTDLIKCFEKFLNPKIENDYYLLSNSEVLTQGDEEKFKNDMKKLFNKDILKDGVYNTPGVNKDIFSLMVSSFNLGLLQTQSERNSMKNPLKTASCATAMDLASNKSVVKSKTDEFGDRVLNYEFNKIVATSIFELAEIFKKKGKYLLNHDQYEYKIMNLLSDLVIKRESMSQTEKEEFMFEDLTDAQVNFVHEVTTAVEHALGRLEKTKEKSDLHDVIKKRPNLSHLCQFIDDSYFKLIKIEVSNHTVSDFSRDLLPMELYEKVCTGLKNDTKLSQMYFTETFLNQCPISDISRNLAQKYYELGDYFECFKFILLQMNSNSMTGNFRHDKHKTVGFKKEFNDLFTDTKISERESNSQAISDALNLTTCVSSALKNLCFYSCESPKSYTSVGPDTGRLKFGLSYKEQVGGNRELYIGDLRTKMFTRLVEDYFEGLTSSFKTSCLNDEKAFENAILTMKLCVRQGDLVYSMDHSKWGPMMSPALFASLLLNLRLPIEWEEECGKDQIILLLLWHVHKLVEVPINVAVMMMKSFIKKNLGLLPEARTTLVEDFFSENFQAGIVPSHVSSVLDMGQGILHNASDFYGLITERFINYCLKTLLGDEGITAFTSSDDQITTFDDGSTKMMQNDLEEFITIMEFHLFLSDSLNKFVSPKSVIGVFAAEFKSRFFIWGDEVPLLTKFVAAALHNVKCKEPHQLAETIDTIIDQGVANGVPISLINKISMRTMKIISYTNYPLDPFLLFCESDVKDWVDGSRGYRLQRSVENLCSDDCKKIRSVLRLFHNLIKSGKLNEEFAIDLFRLPPREALQTLFKICDREQEFSSSLLKVNWLNLNELFPIRMVLRNKVILPSQLTDKDESVPSLLKTIQSKLSKTFTRGAQKLLAESINKSAFQSSIASGFVGLCKTMGSKCVRDGLKNTHFIKTIMSEISHSGDVEIVDNNGIKTFHFVDSPTKPISWWSELLRPVLWDYVCITLCNSFELGTWVLSEPKQPKRYTIPRDPCNYYPIKPGSFSVFEDRVSLSHVIHSIRRLFPTVFEEHLLPFISDLNSLKMKWNPRIKFLDLCVAIDMKCEAISLISHVIKWKRQEHYVVLSSDLAICHIRDATPLSEDRVVSTVDVCKNFMKQIYFESLVREFIVVPSLLGSFSWFPHKEMVPAGENLYELGPLRQYIEKVMLKGSVVRPMYRNDITSDYMWIDTSFSNLELRKANLVHQAAVDLSQNYETITHFLFEVMNTLKQYLTLYFTVKVAIRGGQTSSPLKSVLSYSVTCEVDWEIFKSSGELHFIGVNSECKMSGEIDKYLLQDILLVLKGQPRLKSSNNWFIDLNWIKESVQFSVPIPDSYRVTMDLKKILDEIMDPLSYVSVGERWEPIPLSISCGHLKEGIRSVAEIKVRLNDSDVKLFLEALIDNRSLSNYLYLMLKSQDTDSLKGVDILSVLESLNIDIAILKESFKEVLDWREFRGYNLAFSKKKDSLLIQSSLGQFQFKGRRCDLFPKVEKIEELD